MKGSKKLRNCDQKLCAFLKHGMGCKACDTCGTEPYLLDDDCYRCWNCCKDAGILRWGENNHAIEEKQAQIVKMR